MSLLPREVQPYCLFCERKTHFRQEPVGVRVRIGGRKRLAGRCAVCNNEVSVFLPSDNGPTVHSVRVGETVWHELQRASALLGISQRAIVENILDERMHDFVEDELLEMEKAGLIRPAERDRLERELQEPIEQWIQPEQEASDGRSNLSRLLQSIGGRRIRADHQTDDRSTLGRLLQKLFS